MKGMVTLQVSSNGGWNYFTARFVGDNADAMAADYIKRKGYLVFMHDDDQLDDNPLTQEALYPSCEHGLSASLCAGPNHYPMDNEFF
ncbi:hypothetical protein PP459_gp062 [Streptomyces phage Wakanda]|uniref:Uncharacterized protein n=2 Tax=Wakandavirus TaxID=3044854 RepID=A0A6G8R3I9_9CAUD|nr:hypothetical protein PP459_gp062 [Streptomyces phage Wakanda]YP_010652492.1 hypothetical protein PP460_gp066 [Streptomyces phage Muntaha]QIN94171.1 hypothetical protein SEA_WAKANDA_210 [Streptomyces phage Wakanda]QIN94736.1 hypothetical protein SEA_MUNTAHA_212 [Streptomyces phage Muntaha]